MIPLLELRNLTAHYGERAVLKNVSLRVASGESAALIGPNGAGKTTLLRLIAGTFKPSSGEVILDGQSLAALSRRERSRRIALVPQNFDISFDFTVQQIVEQGRAPYLGLLRGATLEDRRAVDRAIDLADISSFRHRVFNELSGGERQRVKIALGLAQQPRLLLLDEPTQNLDIGRQVELLDLLAHLRREGLTILASIHDLHLIPANFSTVHLLTPDGTLLSGPPEEILTPVNLTEAFHLPSDAALPSLNFPERVEPSTCQSAFLPTDN